MNSGSFLRRLGFNRKARADDEAPLQDPLLPFSARQSGLSECDNGDFYDMTVLMHGAHSRAKRAWLFFDAAGSAQLKEVQAAHCMLHMTALHAAQGGSIALHAPCLLDCAGGETHAGDAAGHPLARPAHSGTATYLPQPGTI